ncbi:hypothetical protein [Adlercreutzia sp. ZJ138]|uniref:hypothetical protein n=1 Tax=Adlercreutzia sp. ZJ138 TaxID=2709405 RepID=UPI0013ECD23B|nr:hypothetical protein [Adlercreutzia sp. ZJ138]
MEKRDIVFGDKEDSLLSEYMETVVPLFVDTEILFVSVPSDTLREIDIFFENFAQLVGAPASKRNDYELLCKKSLALARFHCHKLLAVEYAKKEEHYVAQFSLECRLRSDHGKFCRRLSDGRARRKEAMSKAIKMEKEERERLTAQNTRLSDIFKSPDEFDDGLTAENQDVREAFSDAYDAARSVYMYVLNSVPSLRKNQCGKDGSLAEALVGAVMASE